MRIAENFDVYLKSPSSYDCINITVDGSPESNLFFEGLESKIALALNEEKKISLEIFLDLTADSFSFYNDLQFSIRKRSIEILLDTIKNIPEEKIHHIILYRGTIDFTNYIQSNIQVKNDYISWKKDLIDNSIDEEHLLHLFSTHLLSNFFHSIGAILPDHIKGAILLNIPQHLHKAKIAELISSETFAHLDVGIRYSNFFIEGICWGKGQGSHSITYDTQSEESYIEEEKIKTAVILPFLGFCNYTRFEEICNLLNKKKIPFKIIEENLINEKWFNIDHILFDHETISYDGQRMLEGFLSAGGKVYSFESSKKIDKNILSEFSSIENFVNSNT